MILLIIKETLIILKIHQALKIYVFDADFGRKPYKIRQLGNVLPGSQKPQRQSWVGCPLLFLKQYERFEIVYDLFKFVAVADFLISLRRGRIQRDAQFIQPGLDQTALALIIEKDTVGIKQDANIAGFEVPDDCWKLFI